MEPQILYGVLYLEINLMASLLVLFIRFKTLGISRMVSQRNFSSAIDAEIVFFSFRYSSGADHMRHSAIWGDRPDCG